MVPATNKNRQTKTVAKKSRKAPQQIRADILSPVSLMRMVPPFSCRGGLCGIYTTTNVDDNGGSETMCDERERLGKALKRIAHSEQRRGHATWFHADKEFQGPMEVEATAQWAREMNKRHGHGIGKIRKNPEVYPDCLAELNGGKIGVEVTELVDQDTIKAYQEVGKLQKSGKFKELDPSERLNLLDRMDPEWPLDKFRERLAERVSDKDKRSRDGSLDRQFLLIVTDEPDLDEATLEGHMASIVFPRPNNFDGVYVMASYVPNAGGDGYYPVFEVRLSDPT